jgi:hypothetical protein
LQCAIATGRAFFVRRRAIEELRFKEEDLSHAGHQSIRIRALPVNLGAPNPDAHQENGVADEAYILKRAIMKHKVNPPEFIKNVGSHSSD